MGDGTAVSLATVHGSGDHRVNWRRNNDRRHLGASRLGGRAVRWQRATGFQHGRRVLGPVGRDFGNVSG